MIFKGGLVVEMEGIWITRASPPHPWDLVLSYCFYESAHNFLALKAGGEKNFRSIALYNIWHDLVNELQAQDDMDQREVDLVQ